MSEIHAIEFGGPLGTLRGMMHLPGAAAYPVPAIMLLHGFTGTHIEDHRLFVQMANHAAAAGLAALRFDFYGSGNSDGEFEEMTVLTETADAVAGMDWLGRQPGIDANRIGVVGLSLGGAVTALLAGQDARVKAAVFWNAASLPALHWHDIPRKGPDAYVVGGLRVGPDMPNEPDPVAALRGYAGPGLVIRGTTDEVIRLVEAEALMGALGERGELRLIEGADHTFRHPDWRREVFTITTEWLIARLA